MPNIRWLLRLITTVHRWVYRTSSGAVGHTMGHRRFLLLANVGRRTREMRTTPLIYIDDGPRWIVVASNAGDPRPPAWWLNLQANPDTLIQVGTRTVAVHARQARPDESERLWPRLEAAYSYFPKYRERAEREIPIVVLEPRDSSSEESADEDR